MSELSESLPDQAAASAPALSEVNPVVIGTVGDPVDALHEHVGRLVLAHPGILRLEPTLLTSVAVLGRRSGVDGVAISTHGRVVDLDVNVATRATHQARASLLELHAQLAALVTQHAYVPGTIEISVLAIDVGV